jgi:hypothetical protein
MSLKYRYKASAVKTVIRLLTWLCTPSLKMHKLTNKAMSPALANKLEKK